MRIIIAYILVVPFVQYCLVAGVWLVGFPIALLLECTSVSIRTKIAGVCGGISGVLLAVAFGHGVFRLVIGPGTFTTGAFLASTLPLLVPIRNDFLQWQRVKEARKKLLRTIAERHDDQILKTMTEETCTGHGSSVVGDIAGLTIAVVWFFWR